MAMSPLLGVLGGMGPAATADFLAKLAARTPARCDQEHLPALVYSDPSTPDRSDAILADGARPVPAMLRGVEFLERNGSDLIAIPCNTAHHWYAALAAATSVPIMHIVDAVLAQIEHDAPEAPAIGVLATEGTVHSRIYHERLAATGRAVVDLNDLGRNNPVMGCIRAVKAGELDVAGEFFVEAAELLIARGAQGLVSGCTDISTVLDSGPELVEVPVWDSSEALARACVERLGPQGVGTSALGTEPEQSLR